MKKLFKGTILRKNRPETDNSGFPTVSMGVHIVSEKGQPAYILLRILIAAAGIFGSCFTFLSAMKNRGIDCFSESAAIMSAALGWALFSFVYASKNSRPEYSRKAKNAASLSVIALLLFGIANVRKIAAGFMAAANVILGDIYPKYNELPLFDPDIVIADIIEKSPGTSGADFIDLALCFIILLVAAAACRGIVQRPVLILFFMATFPLAEVCLYFGLVPDYAAFALLCASWCAALAAEITHSGVFADKGAGELFSKTSTQSALAAFLAMLLCFGGAALFAGGHIRPDSVENFRTAFAVYMRSFSWEKFTEDLADAFLPSDNPSVTHDGKLGNVDSVEFGGDAMLYVSLPENTETLYLKGFTAVEYQGSRWIKGEELPILESKLTSQEFFAVRIMKSMPPFEGLSTQSVTVRNVGMSNSVRYYPSNAAGLLETDGKRRRYGVYFPTGNWRQQVMDSAEYITLNGETQRDEAAMRAYAYTYCLDVPETFTAYEEFFEDYRGVTLYEELSFIRTKLAEECSYDLTAGKKPFGMDFAQWFLTENKRGSCTHFATAAALLCRSRGIPARYCEGFIVKADDIEQTAEKGENGYITVCVPDSRAHAWVEVYVDNVGWVSFEATPGYGNIAVTVSGSSDNSAAEETSVITSVETEPPMFGSEDMTITTAVNPENAAGDMTEVTVSDPVQTAVSDVSNAPAGTDEPDTSEPDIQLDTIPNPEEVTYTVTMQSGEASGSESSNGTDSNNIDGTSAESLGSENFGSENPSSENSESEILGNVNDPNTLGSASENISPSGIEQSETDPNGQPGFEQGIDISGAYPEGTAPGGQSDINEQGDQSMQDNVTSTHESPDQTDSTNNEQLRKTAAAAGKVLLAILIPIAVAAFVISGFIGRRKLILRRRGRLCETSPDKAAAEIYRLLAKAAKSRNINLSGIPSEELGAHLEKSGMPAGCTDIVAAALKARFGGGITVGELNLAETAYNKIMAEIIRTKRDRLVYKYLKCSDKIR
ncbi:MAG: hypothetical protein K2K57_07535 [Oscillospiraceae bacterium]|nr:hypothetical protein [Oscillospiraceae bacterium]